MQHLMEDFTKRRTHGSAYTDISGGVLQAAQFLHNTPAGEKYLILFSDLAEDLPHDHTRNLSIKLDGINVVAVNVTKLSTDRSEERRVGKECRSRWSPYLEKKIKTVM